MLAFALGACGAPESTDESFQGIWDATSPIGVDQTWVFNDAEYWVNNGTSNARDSAVRAGRFRARKDTTFERQGEIDFFKSASIDTEFLGIYVINADDTVLIADHAAVRPANTSWSTKLVRRN